MALDDLSGFQVAVAVMATFWALKALRPAQFEQRVLALFFSAELLQKVVQTHPFLELNRVLGHGKVLAVSEAYDITPSLSQELRIVGNQEYLRHELGEHWGQHDPWIEAMHTEYYLYLLGEGPRPNLNNAPWRTEK